jgi:hypothetical protein
MVNQSANARNPTARHRVGPRTNRTRAASASTPVEIETDSPRITRSQPDTCALHASSRTVTTSTRRTTVRRTSAATVTASVAHATVDSTTWATTMAKSEGHSAIQAVTPHGRTDRPDRLVSPKSSQVPWVR